MASNHLRSSSKHFQSGVLLVATIQHKFQKFSLSIVSAQTETNEDAGSSTDWFGATLAAAEDKFYVSSLRRGFGSLSTRHSRYRDPPGRGANQKFQNFYFFCGSGR
jgi:hypothetical protein